MLLIAPNLIFWDLNIIERERQREREREKERKREREKERENLLIR